MSPMNNLFESIQVNTLSLDESQLPFLYVLAQKEFCPTIDASLVAALVIELESDGDGRSITPTEDKIAALRATLRELSLHANSELKIEYPEHSDFDLSATSQQNDWTSASSLIFGNGNEESSGSSSSSSSDFSFVFLRTALPDVPTAKLKQALDKHERDNLDLWDVIATLLTEESIRELEERGLDASENEEIDVARSHVDRDMGWELVKKNKKETSKRTARNNSDRRPKPRKIALNDIRQQHHVPSDSRHPNSPSSRTNGSRTSLFLSSPDPWTQLSSLATHLSSLLPPTSPSFFSSYFHSPKYPTSHDALRSALISLSNYDPSSDVSEENTTLLINILDIVLASNSHQEFDLIIDQRSRVFSDVELAICATKGRANDALDLVYLLRELDNDSTMGLMHLPSPPSSPSRASGQTNSPIMPPRPTRPSDSLPTSPIRRAKANSLPTFTTTRCTKPSTSQWQVVPLRKKAIQLEPGPHPNNIQSYTKEVNDYKIAGSVASTAGNSWSSREEMYDAGHFRAKMRQVMARRDQALMDATILYKDCKKNRNRGVALYYAEKVCIGLLRYVYPKFFCIGKRSTRTSEGGST